MKLTQLPNLILCLALAVLSPRLSRAQSKPIKFGDISAQDLAMTSYAPDTSASAVVLSDVGSSYYRLRGDGDLKYIFNRHVRIKILEKAGYEHADVDLLYYKPSGTAKEYITNLKGATYNLVESRVHPTKLSKESIFDEKTTDDGMNRRKFTFPNVKEGSIIEYTYTIESDFYYSSRTWEFQTDIPTMYSEYTTNIPEFLDFKMFSRGYEPFVINTRKPVNENLGGGMETIRVTEHKWAMQDVPALKEEPFMTTMKDYRAGIEFELALITIPGVIHKPFMDTWERINRNLLDADDFGKNLNRTGFVKKEVATFVSQHSDPTQCMTAIYTYLAKHIKWNEEAEPVTDSGNSTKKAYENRTGSSADINLLLVAMLREAKLNANPVILSTRGNGRIETSLPMVKRFNYVVAHVRIGGEEYLLDATEPMAPLNMLPERCLNGQGFLVSEQGSGWVSLVPKHKHTTFFNALMTIDQSGVLSGQVTTSKNGYAALPVRRTIQVDGQKKYLENLMKSTSGFEMEKLEIKNTEDPTKALSISYNFTGESQPLAQMLYLNPMLTERVKENPFKLENRKFPVDMTAAQDRTYICKLTIPEGYVLEEKPKDIIVSLPEGKGRFAFSVTTLGNDIQVLSSINLPKPVYFAEEYTYLKEFYNLIVAKHAEQIVLKKL